MPEVLPQPTVLPASAIEPEALTNFYRRVFPERSYEQRWRWLYRTCFPGRPFPLVMLDGQDVIAHAGGMPFIAGLGGREYRTSWFIDFIVSPGLERRGLGTRLTQAWMDRSEICVTFCNERSMGVFRRFGWVESFDTSFHTIWVRPFEHPRAVPLGRSMRSSLNRLSVPIAAAWHRRTAAGEPVLGRLDADGAEAMSRANIDVPGADVVAPERTRDYFEWRIAASPDRDRYRLYRQDAVMMLICLREHEPSSLDVLWISDGRESAHRTIRAMLSSLALFAIRHGYAAVRHYPPTRALSRYLRGLAPVVSRPRFAYWTKEPALLDRLRRAEWSWQLIDSDFEWL